MGMLIEYGSRIQKIGIDKFDCAEGVVVKAMFLNYSRPYARNLAYDEMIKRSVECTEEMALKYGLNPKPRYFFLVAAFQQDMQGNILGDTEAKVTYMSMSDTQYKHFMVASNNLDKWNGFVTLTKIAKKDNKGKDLSYIEATPASSNAQGFKNTLSKALIERLSTLVKDEGLLKKSIEMIDVATGLYEDKYIELINQIKPQANGQTAGTGNTAPQAVQSAPAPQAIPSSSSIAPNPNVVKTTTTAPATEVVDAQVVDGEITATDDLPF